MSNPGTEQEHRERNSSHGSDQNWLQWDLHNSLGTLRWGCKLPDTLGRLIMNEFMVYEGFVREPAPR